MPSEYKSRSESVQIPPRKSTLSNSPSTTKEAIVEDRRPKNRGYNPDPLLTTKEAANYLNLQPCTLEKWRSQGRGPEPTRIGTRSIRYRLSALVAFVEGGSNA